MNNPKEERNHGIDLLKMIAMFMIIILHCNGFGGILSNTIENSNQYKIAWIIEIIAYSAVDIFALISGYVSYRDKEKERKYTNYIILWLEVVFYGLLITAVFNLFDSTIGLKDYLVVLLPVTQGLYWYFTAYTGLFIIKPILDNGIRNTNNSELKVITVLIIIFFTVFEIIVNQFNLNKGYSFIWITLLYIIGSTIKKCKIGQKIKNRTLIIGIIIMLTITYLYKIYGIEISHLRLEITKDLFISYISPTILLTSIMSLILFSRIKFNKIATKIIEFIIPSSFSIYIINNHRLVWARIMKDLFKPIAMSSLKIIFYPLFFSLSFVIIAIFIDKIRQIIFNKLKIKEALEKIESEVRSFMIE